MNVDNIFFNIKDYEFTGRMLGKGSFGTVYVVKDKSNQEYAAKIIDISEGFDGNQLMMFLRESLILHELDHPCIVKFKGINFKSFTDNTQFQPAILTECMPKGSLRSNLINEDKSLADKEWTPTKKSIILLGITDAMRYLHHKGIVHLDIKPENILIDSEFYPHVCDFGLSRCLPESHEKSVQLSLTSQIGTPLYMAPEILSNKNNKYGPAVDVYAFSFLAYEIITTKKPFGNITTYEHIHNILSGKRPEFPEDINKEIKTLLTKCWSEEPRERPSFDEIFDNLSKNYKYSNETFEEKEIQDFLFSLDEERSNPSQYEPDIIEYHPENKTEKTKSSFLTYFLLAVFIFISLLHCFFLFGFKNPNESHQKIDTFRYEADDDLFVGLNGILGNKNEHDLIEAMTIIQKSSDKGNSYASYILGLLYQNGDVVEGNFSNALFYYNKSYHQGNIYALTRIGSSYNHGYGVHLNYSLAFDYLQSAAKLGNSYAINILGYFYEVGRVVAKNETKAIELYKEAAKLGNPIALRNLGRCYKNGDMVDQNYTISINYFKAAVERGDYYAKNELNELNEIVYKVG